MRRAIARDLHIFASERTIGPVPTVAANGAKIPLLGLGTWDLRGRTCARMVEQALRLGYPHIDTAEMYDNEREVGEGLRASGVKRGSVFITTKIWPSHFRARELESAARACLERLRLSEVDLLLLHWPTRKCRWPRPSARCEGQARGARASHRCVELHRGAHRRRAEGERPSRWSAIRSNPSVPRPVEIARGDPQHGMALVAYSPLARGDSPQRSAGAHRRRAQKTTAQISLRYLVQQNVVVIPRTSKAERLSENAAIFDFT